MHSGSTAYSRPLKSLENCIYTNLDDKNSTRPGLEPSNEPQPEPAVVQERMFVHQTRHILCVQYPLGTGVGQLRMRTSLDPDDNLKHKFHTERAARLYVSRERECHMNEQVK